MNLQDGDVESLEVLFELRDAEIPQFLKPRDRVRYDVVVALSGESAFKIVEFLLAVTGRREEVRESGATLNLHGNGIPVLEAMAFHGAGKQQLFPRPPLRWWVLLRLFFLFHHKQNMVAKLPL